MIASLEGRESSNNDPLAQVIAQAQDASQRGCVHDPYREQAVSLAREMGNGQALTAQLVNSRNIMAMQNGMMKQSPCLKKC
jgi:hypothetical protein